MAAMGEGDASQALLATLLQQHDAVVWSPAHTSNLVPPCQPGCRIASTRWVVKERHQPGDITWANLWHPEAWLFSREWLLTRAGG
jgi:hypothetical protein